MFPTQIEERILAVDGLAPHSSCVLTRPGELDELTVLIEARPEVAADRYPDLARALASSVKHGLGLTVSVDVLPPDALERSLGKARRIVDLRTVR